MESDAEVSIMEEMTQEGQGTPAGEPVGLEAVLQSIHSTIKKNELKLNMLTDSHGDMEDRLSNKLSLAVDKALSNIPTIVNTAVDKRLGAITKDTGNKLDELRDDMIRREKKILSELEVVKKSSAGQGGATRDEVKDMRATADKVVRLEKKLDDMDNRGTRPRPLIAETEYDSARMLLALAPIPHKRGMGLENQEREVFKFLEKVLCIPEEVIELVGIKKITRLTRGKDLSLIHI